MTIADLVVNLRADVVGLVGGMDEGRAAVAEYAQAAQSGIAQATAAQREATAPARQLAAATQGVSAVASQSAGTLGRWSGALSTAASAATVASSAVNVVSGAMRGLRTVQAAGGVARFAASLRTSTGGMRSFIPSARTTVKLLAAVGTAGGLYAALRGLVGAARVAKRALGGVVNQMVLMKGLRSGISSLVGGALGPLGLAIGGAAGGLAGLAGIGAMAAWGVKLSAQAETARVAFTTLTGSAENARALLDQLATFSAGTPFQLPDVQESARKLLAYGRGADAVAADLAVLGDIAAGTGKPLGDLTDIYGRVASTGRVTGDVLTQLLGRGVPIAAALADTMGVAEGDIRDMVSEGVVGFADFQRALESTTRAGGLLAGGMQAQSQTVAGMWSTLTDNFREGFREAFEGATAAFNLSGLLKEITGYVSAGAAVLKEYAAGWSAAAGEGMQWGDMVTKAVGWVGEAIAFAADVAQGFGVKYLRRVNAAITESIGTVIRAVDGMATAIVASANLIPGVELAYTGFLRNVASFYESSAAKQRDWADGLEGMRPAGAGVREFFEDMQTAVDAARESTGEVFREGLTIGVDADTSAARSELTSFADQLRQSTRTPLEEYQSQLGKISETFGAGLIGDDTLQRALKQARDQFEEGVKPESGGGGSRSVGSLEQGSQAAFAAISNRIRGEADAKATAKNTGKIAELMRKADRTLAQVERNTRERGEAVEAGPAV